MVECFSDRNDVKVYLAAGAISYRLCPVHPHNELVGNMQWGLQKRKMELHSEAALQIDHISRSRENFSNCRCLMKGLQDGNGKGLIVHRAST